MREDLYSDYLNFYGSATITQASLLRATFVPSLTLYSERRSEFKAYLRETYIGAGLGLTRALPRRTHALGYSIELGKTTAQPALYCAVFNACVVEDQQALKEPQRLAVLSASSSYERTDNPLDRRAVSPRASRRATPPSSSAPMQRWSSRDSRWTAPSTIRSAATSSSPAACGSGPCSDRPSRSPRLTDSSPRRNGSSAAGARRSAEFRQNELGPAIYIPTKYDTVWVRDAAPSNVVDVGDTVFVRADPLATNQSQRAVPTGGNALVVGNVELRIVSPFLPDRLRWTIFADVGEVWNRGADARLLRFSTLKVTPGIGVRVRTPIGFLRADLAYNPYDRPSGAGYFDTPLDEGGRLYCVSPGNTLPATGEIVTTASGTRLELAQAAGACPGSYIPRSPGGGWLRRLTPSIAIGHAF